MSISDDLGIRLVTDEEAERARAHIEALLADVASITPTERAERASQLLDADLLPAACRLAAHEPDYWDAALLRLRAVRGMGRVCDVLAAAIKRQLTGEAVHISPERLGIEPEGWQAPAGWYVQRSGIFGPGHDGKPTQVSRVPLIPVGRLVDTDTSEHYARLTWPAWLGGWHDRVVRMSSISDARALLSAVSAQSGGIHTQNAATMSRFLLECVEHNAETMPIERVLSRCGWAGDGFLLGCEWIGDSDAEVALQVAPGSGEEQAASALGTAGTWEAWLDAVDVDSPDLHLAVYASVASVLVEHCGTARGWVLDWSGETSTGKTTIQRAAASVWGSPVDGALLQSWNTTKARAEGLASFLRNLPLILDDSKNARHPSDVASLLYQHSQGQARGRARPGEGSQGIGLRRSAQWCSVMLSTGEQPAVSFTEDAGSRARCLSLTGPPMSSDAEARSVTLGVLENHGHLGRRVLEHLVGNVPRVQSLYALRLIHYVDELVEAGPVAARLAGLLALLDVARDLVEAVGYPSRPGVMSRAIAAARAGAREADRPREALRAVLEHCAAHPTSFYGRHETDRTGEPITPARGWLGAWPDGSGRRSGWKVAVFERVVLDVLRARGFDPGVIDRWVERGYLLKDSSGSRRCRVRIARARVRAVCFTEQALDVAGLGEA